MAVTSAGRKTLERKLLRRKSKKNSLSFRVYRKFHHQANRLQFTFFTSNHKIYSITKSTNPIKFNWWFKQTEQRTASYARTWFEIKADPFDRNSFVSSLSLSVFHFASSACACKNEFSKCACNSLKQRAIKTATEIHYATRWRIPIINFSTGAENLFYAADICMPRQFSPNDIECHSIEWKRIFFGCLLHPIEEG